MEKREAHPRIYSESQVPPQNNKNCRDEGPKNNWHEIGTANWGDHEVDKQRARRMCPSPTLNINTPHTRNDTKPTEPTNTNPLIRILRHQFVTVYVSLALCVLSKPNDGGPYPVNLLLTVCRSQRASPNCQLFFTRVMSYCKVKTYCLTFANTNKGNLYHLFLEHLYSKFKSCFLVPSAQRMRYLEFLSCKRVHALAGGIVSVQVAWRGMSSMLSCPMSPV